MDIDPRHWHSNESGKASEDVYDDFKMKKPFGLYGLYNTYFTVVRFDIVDNQHTVGYVTLHLRIRIILMFIFTQSTE